MTEARFVMNPSQQDPPAPLSRRALRDAERRTEQAVGQAEENLRIRRQQFDAGRASSEDVLDAQALVSNQRALRASALYQAHVRLAELHSLMGRDLAGSSREGTP